MNHKFDIELEADGIKYYSQHDEDAFFGWLGKISCITEIGGRGRILSMKVQADLVDQEAMRELLAVFHRYGIDKSHLSALVRPEFAHWFYDKDKYWNAEQP